MSESEEASLREVMRDGRYFNLLPFFELALMTGMRASEILGLRFSEIDFGQAEIHLPAERTKEAQEKTIPLNSVALEVIKGQLDDRTDEVMIFGHVASYPQIRELWREACRKAKVVDLHIHDLRHTFASCLLTRGFRETDINKLLGHSALRMTAKYTHSSEASRREAVDSLAQDCPREEQKVVDFQEI